MSIHAGSTPQNRTPPTIEKRKVSVSLCKFRLTEFSGVWAYPPYQRFIRKALEEAVHQPLGT